MQHKGTLVTPSTSPAGPPRRSLESGSVAAARLKNELSVTRRDRSRARAVGAVPARATQNDVVRVDDVPELTGQAVERVLEALVLEGDDLAAVLADEVMVVLAVRVGGLVAGDAAADVDALHELRRREQVEDAVDARDSDATPRAPELVEDLLGGEAAVLAGQELDDGRSRPTGSVSRPRELGGGVLGPGLVGRAHDVMIAK